MHNFSVSDWLIYLENLHQQEIQLGLERIQKVAQTLNLLTPKAKVITVAGTNGKGSTVAMLEAIYFAAGYSVATYTSPHLMIFNERISVNRQPITDESLCEAFRVIEAGRGAIALTYFEMTTLAALWYFDRCELDLIILEVGLGGRLDATNIISADLAIITTIDFDHMEYLGTTKEAIGYEKAGILRKAKPVIYADDHPPLSFLKRAEELNCSLYLLHRDYCYQLKEESFEFRVEQQRMNFAKPLLHPNSVAAAFMASLIMKKDLAFDFSAWETALAQVYLPGRLQLIKGYPNILLDVSHNPQAVHYLARFLRKMPNKSSIYAVFSALKDKNIAEMLNPLLPLVKEWYPALLKSKRAASKEQLINAFENHGLNPQCFISLKEAFEAAFTNAKPQDLILVFGSFLTVAEILIVMNNSESRLTSNAIKA